MRRLRSIPICAVLALLGGVAGAAPAGAHPGGTRPSAVAAQAAAGGSLTLTAADVPGLRRAGGGARVARAALGGALPKALRGAGAQGAAFIGPGRRRVAAGAFTTRSAARARAAVTQLRSRARHARVRGIGDAAWRRVSRARRGATASVILSAGRGVGVVRVTIPGRGRGRAAAASAAADAYARTLAARLERGLSLTAFERTLEGIRDDGSFPPSVALRAFAIAYGPLPGVRRPRGGELGVPESGTQGMHMVARVWDQLTPAQQAAIDRALGAPHDATSPRRAAARARASAQVLTPDARYQAMAERYAAIYRTRLPGVNPVISVFRASEDITTRGGGKAWADALPVNARGEWGNGPVAYCRVRVPPFGQARAGGPFFQLIMAHEVFHCFQFALAPDWPSKAEWLMEGMADWAATSVYSTTAAVGAGPFIAYLQTADQPTFGRSYDGTGFWHWIDEHNGVGSLWPNIPLAMRASDSAGAFVAVGGGDLGFQESWASAALRLEGAGPSWNQRRPYALPRLSPPIPVGAATDDTVIASARFQAKVTAVVRDPGRPLVSLAGLAGRFRAGIRGRDLGVLDEERWFCFGRCQCPAGSEGEIPPHTRIAGTALMTGLTGGALPGQGRVRYHDLRDFCRRRERRARRGPSGPAESNGDPHLTSFDGLHFDFQAAGEFVLARSRSRDLEIQARQEPYGRSRTVTVNTQIAARAGGRRITVSPGAAADDPPVVRVDGAVDALPAGTVRTFGDATLTRQTGEAGWVEITWGDGSTLVVRPVGKWGVAIVIELSGERANAVAGVLGDFDGRPGNDLADRRGKAIAYTARATNGWYGITRYEVAQEFEPRFSDALYDRFGEDWRISQAESLFDYGPGQSTRTFTNRRIPAKPVDPEDLRRARRVDAERICREAGVDQPGPLADCILDVAATGNAAFAADAKLAQDAASVLWTRLRAGSQITGEITLARAGDGTLHVGWNRDAGGARQLASVAIDPAGREGGEETIAAVDGDAGLFTAAAGTVRAVSAQIPSDGPSGVWQYARDAAGGWSPLGLVTGFGSSYAGRPTALEPPGGPLLTVSPMAGLSRLFVGAPAAGEGVPMPVPDGCYASSPAIARDGASGAVWIAWLQWDCPQVGVFAAPVDPATGAIGAPVQAPGSSWQGSLGADHPDLSLDESLALTGRPGRAGVFLAYERGTRGDVGLWQVGAGQATTIPRADAARRVRIAADPGSGRLWVGWIEDGRLWVQRTSEAGAPDGAPRPVALPPNDTGDLLRLGDLQLAARDGTLDLVFGRRRGDTPGGLYHAQLRP